MQGQPPPPAEGIQPLNYGRVDTAKLLGVSVRTIDTLLATKQLRARRILGRVVIPLTEIKRFNRGDHPFADVG